MLFALVFLGAGIAIWVAAGCFCTPCASNCARPISCAASKPRRFSRWLAYP
jgi:hypothetical protein